MTAFTHNLNIVARCTRMQRTQKFKDLGLCGGQVPYLLRLCRNPGLTQEALARALYVNKSTAARTINHLEKAGYVERRPSAEDKRCLTLHPTDLALEALPRIREVIRGWNDYLLEDFDEAERALLMSMMEKVSQRAQSYICREGDWDA